MMENKRFRKVLGFIQDNTCEGGDVEGVMDLTEIEDMLNELNNKNNKLKTSNKLLKNELSWIKDYAYWKEKEAFDKLFGYYMITVDEYRIMVKENQYLKELLMYCCEVSECEIEDELERMKSE